eukprot:CAMPEP_0172507330 /NCGR_PEP_ID=MMETSP1066-20121228/202858_1 /TAXON_ID=671091 /ORGANISM="Coscinodiscus wailesii, Strain CCMP2513" /LENGTH=63 /DNA_ID=CAMNT_0013284845 /DNA_START=301 /DNA_END=489 /DNA_ORIENTATION=+
MFSPRHNPLLLRKDDGANSENRPLDELRAAITRMESLVQKARKTIALASRNDAPTATRPPVNP